MSKPSWRHWTEQEEAFLRCPIPAAYLQLGALAARSLDSIRWRRRELGIHSCLGLRHRFVSLTGSRETDICATTGRPAYQLTDFPGQDWNKALRELMQDTGLGLNTVTRLRKEAGARPYRTGRRGYRWTDFPNVDWGSPVKAVCRDTGLSWKTARRLRDEFREARRLLRIEAPQDGL